jgi:hypothetical protein
VEGRTCTIHIVVIEKRRDHLISKEPFFKKKLNMLLVQSFVLVFLIAAFVGGAEAWVAPAIGLRASWVAPAIGLRSSHRQALIAPMEFRKPRKEICMAASGAGEWERIGGGKAGDAVCKKILEQGSGKLAEEPKVLKCRQSMGA